jgi:hypothetical protein
VRTRAPQAKPDEFEAEFQDDLDVPDYATAYHLWQRLKPSMEQASRLCKGFDVSRGLTAEAFAALDMQSRWEIYLRARFEGTWPGSPMHLQVFPQAR